MSRAKASFSTENVFKETLRHHRLFEDVSGKTLIFSEDEDENEDDDDSETAFSECSSDFATDLNILFFRECLERKPRFRRFKTSPSTSQF